MFGACTQLKVTLGSSEEGVPQVVVDMIPLLLHPDPEKLSSGTQVLVSRGYEALQHAAVLYGD